MFQLRTPLLLAFLGLSVMLMQAHADTPLSYGDIVAAESEKMKKAYKEQHPEESANVAKGKASAAPGTYGAIIDAEKVQMQEHYTGDVGVTDKPQSDRAHFNSASTWGEIIHTEIERKKALQP